MQYPLLDVFLSMLWFFLFILWIFVLVRVIMDIFRSRDMGGFAKAGWLIFTILLPFLGVLVYLVARGGTMAEREVQAARDQDQAFRAYVRDAAREGEGGADELAKLADLRDKGIITQADFERGKEKVLSHRAA